ncbi:MAG: hypothetical protein EAZ55_03850 [Cytophagales bacterium]|nr:MAG: hypothetical protein EAZ55_03850 [Cytophagales bacterium]
MSVASVSLANNENPSLKNTKRKKAKKQIQINTQEEDLNLYYEDPIPAVIDDFVMPGSIIDVKVVDLKGNIIVKDKVTIEQFLESKHSLDSLPKNSLFVLFYNNTAYYVLDVQ